MLDHRYEDAIAMKSFVVNAIETLAAINKADRKIYEDCFQIKHFKKGDFFLQEGQVCRYMGLIESGIMRTFIMQEGMERTFGFISEMGFLTNYESFVTQRPSFISIQALEDTTVHVASFENFEYIYQHARSGDRIGRLVLGREFIKLQHELTSFYTDSPVQRYQKFITAYPSIQQRISQYYIASFVGVKPPSLSRIRKRILSQ